MKEKRLGKTRAGQDKTGQLRTTQDSIGQHMQDRIEYKKDEKGRKIMIMKFLAEVKVQGKKK